MIAAGAAGLMSSMRASAPLVALLNAGTAGIYRTSAPTTAVTPYIIMTHMAGGSTNRTPRQEFDQRWLIKAIAQGGTGQGVVRQIADLVYTALHDTKPTLPSPWSALDCQHETPVEYEELVEHENIWYAGGIYRLRATQ